MEIPTGSVPTASPLRRWRTANGLTLEEFGRRVGLSKSRLSEIECGSSCTLETALAIEVETRGEIKPCDLRPPPLPSQPMETA